MELTSDLIAVQGLLKSLQQATGDFSKIRYRSGNENKILLIVKEIKDFLSMKQYVTDDGINVKYQKQVDDIVLFLTLNSEFENESIYEIKEYMHLIGICPRISKCILLNVILELNLTESYCSATKNLPLVHLDDLIKEIIPAIKKLQLEPCLDNSFIFLRHFSTILLTNQAIIDDKAYDAIIKVASELLLIATRINPEYLSHLKKIDIYKHMGITLLKLLDLLDCCTKSFFSTEQFIKLVVESTCILIKSITLEIFCAWSEVKHNNEILQITVGEKALEVIQKYQKLEYAKDLIQMLVTIAKKPRTIIQMIKEADTITIIQNVYKADSHQKLWFNALLNTQIFNDKKAINCIEECSHLCNLPDVDRILDLSQRAKTATAKKLALKCAENLNVTDLTVACTRYFFKYGLSNALHKDISPEITLLLNKTKEGDLDMLTKQILLLSLQNPPQVIDVLLAEALKSSLHFKLLRHTFEVIHELLQIEKLLITCIRKLLKDFKPSNENTIHYSALFTMLFETNCLTWNNFIDNLVLPYFEEYSNDYDSLTQFFSLLNQITVNNKLCFNESLSQFLDLVFRLLDNVRFTFFDFAHSKCALTTEITHFLKKNKPLNESNLITCEVNNWINIYYLNMYNQAEEVDFYQYFFSNLNLQDEADSAAKLLKILPSCVEHEWISVIKKIVLSNDESVVLQLLTNVLLLLAQAAKTRRESDNVLSAMKYYLACYTAAIRTTLTMDEIGTDVCMQLCRIIRELPDEIMEESALKLIPLLPQNALAKLGEDKSFLCLLVSIKNKNISQIIAKRVMESKNA